MMDEEFIEGTRKAGISFIEQLQNQIQLCRFAFSDPKSSLISQVEALESLLWAKLKDDQDYLEQRKKIFEEHNKIMEQVRKENPNEPNWWIEKGTRHYRIARSKRLFKEIMIFIDKKDYLKLGEF